MIKLDRTTAIGVAGGAVIGTLVIIGVDRLIDHLTRYDANGFDKLGFDRDGYDRHGYNREGYNRAGYDIDGFDRHGFDDQGFDCEGYDHQGFTADGYDRSGRDRRGFNRDGFDAEGYDRFGRDVDGYYRTGFDRDGFNRAGYDRHGYGRDYYSTTGFDRAGRTSGQYVELLVPLYDRLRDAKYQLDHGEYRYAINDARLVMEEILRLVVEHAGGVDGKGDCLLENLRICENKTLLPVEDVVIDRLHDVRHICNEVTHEIEASERLTHPKTYFVVMQTHDLLKAAEKTLCCA